MQLPAQLSRRNPRGYKTNFGHVLVLAGSEQMLGAAALTSLAAARCGAGLVTLGVPEGLNNAAQKKVANVIMTWPLAQTSKQSLALGAFKDIKQRFGQYSAIAIGPGLSQHPHTQKLIRMIVAQSPVSLIIDADGLNALSGHLDTLKKTATEKILTPHPGEMARLVNKKIKDIEKNRKKFTSDFAARYRCTLLLKGHHTVVGSPEGKTYVNKTGNVGMASGGSGDVLTGIIAAFRGQHLNSFEAAKFGAYIHGLAGDLAAKSKTKLSMIASDIIENIPAAIRKSQK